MRHLAPTDPASTLLAARDAWHRRAWAEAYAGLAAADLVHPLDPDDLERLAAALDTIERLLASRHCSASTSS